jgi:hypothetical protein
MAPPDDDRPGSVSFVEEIRMSRRRSVMLPLIPVVVMLAVLVGTVAAQSGDKSGSGWTPPRTPDGQPDIRGVWGRWGVGTQEKGVEYPDVRPGGRPEEKGGKVEDNPPYPVIFLESGGVPPLRPRRGTRGPGGIVDPSDGRLPWRPDAAARRNEIMRLMLDAPSLEYVDPHIRCMPPGVPRGGGGGNHFMQVPGKVIILTEYDHVYRVIPLDGRPHVGPAIRLFMGNSRGRWQGSTLVVETTNFTGKTWYDMVGTYQSDALRTIERFTIVDADTMTYEVTIDDPKLFTKPWKTAGGFYRAEKGYELMEHACAEGSRFQLENNLRRPVE